MVADQHCDFNVNPVVADPATAQLDGTVDAVLTELWCKFRRSAAPL